MKYTAILTYTNGSVTGATVEAETLQEAWQKLMPMVPTEHLQSVQIAEVLTTKYEIK